jgi:hypothetical protein
MSQYLKYQAFYFLVWYKLDQQSGRRPPSALLIQVKNIYAVNQIVTFSCLFLP